jgi:CheY-like chemotaxis protein
MNEIGRVLVIDDDPLQLEVIRDYLIRRGIQGVVSVADSQVASRLIKAGDRQKIDLVISDIHMPGVDGIELLSTLSTARPLMPLILISGARSDQLLSARILAEGYGLNVLGVFGKPADERELDEALQRHPHCRPAGAHKSELMSR